MPNFITKNLNLQIPFQKDEVEFISILNGRSVDLVRTKSFDSEFFIVVKKNGDNFIIKGEKVTKPAKIGHLQKALKIFRDNFCENIISESFAFKTKQLTEKTVKISDENGILQILQNHKFENIFIEIGFGSGRHLLYQAKTSPNTLLIGIEIYKPAIEQVAKLAIKSNLDNVVLLNSDARIFLSMISSNLIDKIFLHFPVPWDDAPHRRVISDEFVKECKRVLKVNGKFELRTDSENYFEFAKLKFANFANLQIYKNQNLQISSKYEDRWKKMDKDIFDMIAINSENSQDLNLKFDFSFPDLNSTNLAQNFKNISLKFENFFIHFEEFYTCDDEKFIKVSLGAFDLPQQCYILISPKQCSYFAKFPLKTKENQLAHKEIIEVLKQWK